MAIRDLLWACPSCGARGTLRPRRRGREACESCGAVLRRTEGAAIEVRTPDGRRVTRSAAEWADALPAAHAVLAAPGAAWPAADVELRRRTGQDPIRHAGEYLNLIDRFGDPETGRLELTPTSLRFRTEERSVEWPLDDVAAVGSSSKNLQLRIRKGPVLSIRLPESSIRFWEELVREALRIRYRAAGRGDIAEFQPRIVSR